MCSAATELEAVNALRRQALAFRFSESMRLPQHEHLSFRALRAHQPPPPGYSAVSLAQILRADRAAWNMIAEKISTLKRNAQGDLPLELEIQRVLAHPSVSFHLLPLPSKPAPSAPVRPGNKREREREHTVTNASENSISSSSIQRQRKVPRTGSSSKRPHKTHRKGIANPWRGSIVPGLQFGKGLS